MSYQDLHRTMRTLLAGASALLACACTADTRAENEDDVAGAAVVALTEVPSDVSCIRIVAAGSVRTETRDFDVMPSDSSAELRLSRLPLGLVTFEASAFDGACAAVDANSVPGWVSDPVDATLHRGQVAEVALRMIRNGRTSVSVDFADEELNPSDTEGCTEVNLALNPSRSGYPNPASESDAGWGGGSYPWDIVDGATKHYDTWAHGLAFTGGELGYAGAACGRRQATIDFGAMVTVHRALIWHHGDSHVPSSAGIEYWNGASWVSAGDTMALRNDLRSDTDTWGAVPTEHLFPEVTSSKLRFWMDNCDTEHGWLYETEFFGCE